MEAVLGGPTLKSKDAWWCGGKRMSTAPAPPHLLVSVEEQQRSAFRSTWIRVPALGSALVAA